MARPIKRLYAERNVTEELRRWARSTTIGARDKERANIILLRRGRQNPLQNQARSRRPRQSRGRMNYVMAIESQHIRFFIVRNDSHRVAWLLRVALFQNLNLTADAEDARHLLFEF